MHDPKAFVEGEAGLGRAQEGINELLKSLDWSQVGPHPRILDYGCGPGRLSHHFVPYLEKWNGSLVGVDVSPQMVEFAKGQAGHPRIEYRQGNLFQSGSPPPAFFAPASYDIIICSNVLYYFKPYKQALVELAGLLKPGGQLGLTTRTESVYFPLLQDLANEPKFKSYMEQFDYKSYIPEWIERAVGLEQDLRGDDGALPSWLKLIRLETVQITERVELNRLANLLYSVGPLSGRLPSCTLEEDVKKWYRQKLRAHYEVVEDAAGVDVILNHASETVWGVFQREQI